jgi:release factor glutamine methyltransferase
MSRRQSWNNHLMATYNQVLKSAYLKARDDFDSLAFKRYLVELCSSQNIDLYLHMDDEMPRHIQEVFNEGIEALLQDTPLAHVLGYEWFYGRQFKVNGDVLIPRPETEELVAHVLDRIETLFGVNPKIKVADVACGSGIIGCTLKAELPTLEVVCTDLSEPALNVAKENARSLNIDVTFRQGDMLLPLLGETWDVIVCNPPYIELSETLDRSVKDYEPHLALFGGEDGLMLYRRFLDQLDQVIANTTLVAFEMGYQQRQLITQEILKRFPQVQVECEIDLNGKERMLFFVAKKP